MDTYEAVRTMLAVRRFQDTPIPDDVLRRVVEAGRLSASAMNAQPWHFIVIRERETLVRLGALVSTGPYIAEAAAAIVVAIKKSRIAVSDGARAIQSMLLTAWSEGVGGTWAGFGGMAEVSTLLGIPAELEVLAILPLGYPAVPVGRGKKNRKPLGEIAHSERFDTPFG